MLASYICATLSAIHIYLLMVPCCFHSNFALLCYQAEGIEDRLDFSVSFAVNPNNHRTRDETESDDNEDSSS